MITRLSVLMAGYVKRVHSEKSVEGEYYHWHNECPDYPKRGKETILIFKKKPTHIPPCPKCAKLDSKEK
jgi:hypothetical protein